MKKSAEQKAAEAAKMAESEEGETAKPVYLMGMKYSSEELDAKDINVVDEMNDVIA